MAVNDLQGKVFSREMNFVNYTKSWRDSVEQTRDGKCVHAIDPFRCGTRDTVILHYVSTAGTIRKRREKNTKPDGRLSFAKPASWLRWAFLLPPQVFLLTIHQTPCIFKQRKVLRSKLSTPETQELNPGLLFFTFNWMSLGPVYAIKLISLFQNSRMPPKILVIKFWS